MGNSAQAPRDSRTKDQKASLDWKLSQRTLPSDYAVNEELLQKIGVAKAATVKRKLFDQGRKTWGSLLKLKSKEEAISATGDETSGKAMWDYLEKYRAVDLRG